jgi:hypothetical protein
MKINAIPTTAALLGAALIFGGADCFPDPDDGDPPAESQFGEYIEAMCDFNTRCEAEMGKVYPDKQTCVELATAVFDCGIHFVLGSYEYTLAYIYDETAGPECVQWIEGASCDQAPNDGPAACDDVISFRPATGNYIEVGEGESCGESVFLTGPDEDVRACGRGLYCESSGSNEVCNVCRRNIAAGQPCEPNNDRCDDPLFCDGSSQTCIAHKAVGEACAANTECEQNFCKDNLCAEPLARDAACVAGDSCYGALRCDGGVCTDPLTEGEACPVGDGCQAHLVCSEGTCKSMDWCSPGAVDQPCNSWCVDGTVCDMAEMVCRAQAQAGEACTGYYDCVSDASCDMVNGVCVAYAALSDDCGSSATCDPYEAYCDYTGTATCSAFKTDGEACAQSYECGFGWCDSSASTCTSECSLP